MKIGLCTGVYDLLHEGHTNFFKRADKVCDLLIIAVASDWITKVQKGATRPIQTEAIRIKAVEDYCEKQGIPAKVIKTSELDFTSWWDKGIVDVFIWGEDQANVLPIGKECNIVILNRTPGISTSDYIDK